MADSHESTCTELFAQSIDNIDLLRLLFAGRLGVLSMANPQHLAIDAYISELTELAQKRMEIERRSARVEKGVRAMIDLLDGEPEYETYLEKLDDVLKPAGLTIAILALVKAAGDSGLTPVEVKDMARTMLSGHSNPVASVHTILKRLAKNGEIEPIAKDGKPAYRAMKRLSFAEQYVQDLQRKAAESGHPAMRLQRRRARTVPPPPGLDEK